jgi:glycosyltransferase involved in cell wall biosynthesis
MATGLDSGRYRSLVILPSPGPLKDDLDAAGIETQVRPVAVLRRALFTPRGAAGLVVRATADAVSLGRLVRARGISLVHSNTSVVLSGATAARVARVPHIFSVREIYADFARFWPYYRPFLLRASALCCVSEATLAQFGGHPRAHVLHDGIGPVARANRSSARRDLGLSDDVFVCATLGRISSWKGQDILARALTQAALARAGAIGLVAGDAWPGQEHYEENLRALARDPILGERLRLLGFRPDTSTIYGAADVVVVPSTNPDPLPNVALEAAACGCCVVAADHGGLPEIIREGKTGRLFTAGQPEALAAVLDELRQDSAQRARLGAAASADIAERFAPARLLEGLHAIYDQVLTRSERRA